MHIGVANSKNHEHEERYNGMNKIYETEFELIQIFFNILIIIIITIIVVKDVETIECGDAIVKLSFLVGEAISKRG